MTYNLRPSTKQKTYKSRGIKSTNITVQRVREFEQKLSVIRRKYIAKVRRRGWRGSVAAIRIPFGQWGLEYPGPIEVADNSNN